MQTYFECPKDCRFFNSRKSESSDGKIKIEMNFCLRYNKKLQGNGRSWRLGYCAHDEGICTNCGSKTWVRKSDDEILFKEQGFVDGYKCTRCKMHTDFRKVLRIPVPQAHLTKRAPDACPYCAGKREFVNVIGKALRCNHCAGTGQRR